MSHEECTAHRGCGKPAVAIAHVGSRVLPERVPVCAGCTGLMKSWDHLVGIEWLDGVSRCDTCYEPAVAEARDPRWARERYVCERHAKTYENHMHVSVYRFDEGQS